jgi:hypothetical protein
MSKSGFARRLAGPALLGSLAIGLAWTPTASAGAPLDNPSDIPGVPLPGPVATGRLGGPIYDVVYRLTVAPGSVIVAGLAGSAGTDFDLYLFDASASTVLSDVGLVAKSTRPASAESISAPSPSGGTYYLDLNGATDVEGDYRLTAQVVPDRTPPTVSMVLADGRAATNQLTVAATVDASDDLSGVAEMALSADGTTYAGWTPYRRSTTWTFTPGDGLRTLWAKVRNGAGIESPSTTATVTIDTVQPSADELIPAPGSTVAGLRPTFAVTFDEPMAPASWTDFGLIVQEATGDLVAGDYTYDVARRTGTFVPSSALHPGATYVVTIGNVTDVAGNRLAPRGSWTVTPLAPASLEARAVPSVITFGGSSRIDLVLTGTPEQAVVTVQARPSSSTTFTSPEPLAVADGRATLSVTPERNTVYRFTYAGDSGTASAQAETQVQVRRAVAFVGAGSSSVSRARVGRPVRILAAVRPVTPVASVSFRLYRYNTVRRQWVYAGSRGRRTDAAGRASVTWTPTSPGSYYWRVAVAATTDHAASVSAVYRWSVTR